MYNSQFGEDKWVHENIALPKKGVFVDVGAGDPVTFSNTYLFEKLGWKGLCVDADSRHIQNLKSKRSCHVVHGQVGTVARDVIECKDPDYTGTMPFFEGEKKQVEHFTLGKLLRVYNIKKIDLLSIDVEGTEIDVFESFNYEKHPVSTLIVEYKTARLDSAENTVKRYFEEKGFTLRHKTEANYIFTY
jgi:FkbM family methyltransferase